MASALAATVLTPHAWREPVEVLCALGEAPFAVGLLSDGSAQGRWSYVACAPLATFHDLDSLRAALPPAGAEPEAVDPSRPPFTGGAMGLAAHEWGARLEPTAPQARRTPPWPDFVGGVYASLLAFDHAERRVWAVGRGASPARARARAARAEAQLATPAPPPGAPDLGSAHGCAWDRDYPGAVRAVVEAIASGEVFQANIARGWTGDLPTGVRPLDLLSALHRASPAPFAGYLRLPGRALVSRSPERFLQVSRGGVAVASPIKGTRPRAADPVEDARLLAELVESAKDRAENLMIVDVMRNDLARACRPGSVQVDRFCAPASFSNVHHLVSTVSGRLAPGVDALTLFAAAFPPASVTGAPKLQALQVIARHEPPRGPYCGSLFWAGHDGALDSSVLIRTVALDARPDRRWRWEARAGAGITFDSDPAAEDAEAAGKASSFLSAFAP